MPGNDIVSDWFDQYGDDIYHFLLYRVGPKDAEDLVQEVFLKAFKAADKFQYQSSPRTWLYSVARNVANDEFRKRKSRKRADLLSFDGTLDIPSTDTPESIFYGNEEAQRISRAIQSLKSNYQEVLILRGIKELSIKETAEILSWSESKVRSTQTRARRALIQQLGGWESDGEEFSEYR
ncbi:RNA polymerase sigma factor [Radiobacillus sp. PE A8.2]|uniref:RNA polymerase sigma factor n=1 Tax=Radiobacillus sp. PE A8.2 TaxID=3380349 RepID=UPI00388E60D9